MSNFGFYASPQRTLVFDLNDFDEAAWAPWEWDVKRLVASIVVAGQATARDDAVTRAAAEAAGRTIRIAVKLDPALASKLKPGTTVFVSAREAGIPGPPIAAVRISSDEPYILQCLEREKRCGRVEKTDAEHYRFIADVHDAGEMLPWLRTFIGRIESFSCSNKAVEEKFWQDLAEVYAMYGVKKAGEA